MLVGVRTPHSLGWSIYNLFRMYVVICVTDLPWHPPDPPWPTAQPFQTHLQSQGCYTITPPTPLWPLPLPALCALVSQDFPSGGGYGRGDISFLCSLPSVLCESSHGACIDLTSRPKVINKIKNEWVLFSQKQKPSHTILIS